MMLDEVKQALRIKSAAFDGELTQLIEAAKMDLVISGIKQPDDGDALIKRAVIVYCQANFGASADAERYQRSYELLKSHLALCGDYNGRWLTP